MYIFFSSNQNLVSLVYLNLNDDIKQHTIKTYYLPKGLIKGCNIIINGKEFYGQPIDFELRQYEE